MDDHKTTDKPSTQERASAERPASRERPGREVLRVGELPDDVVKAIEEAEYGAEPI